MKCSITIRFKDKEGRITTIAPGTPFNEGDIPEAHYTSLKKSGLLMGDEEVKPVFRSLVMDTKNIDMGRVVLNREVKKNDQEKIFDGNPSDYEGKSLAELRMIYAERCNKFNINPKSFKGKTGKAELIAELCKDNPEVKTHGYKPTEVSKPAEEDAVKDAKDVPVDELDGLIESVDDVDEDEEYENSIQ